MALLTSKTKVSEVLKVAIGYNETDFNKFITEAQDFDLKKLMCEEFYYDLMTNKDDEPYLKLIQGGDYQYNDRTYSFRGLEDVIAYFTYARFVLECNYNSTSHGYTIKKTPHSEPVPLEEKRSMYYKYKKDANTLMDDVVKFIERTISDFPTWNYCENNCDPKRTTGFTTKVIK